MRLACCIVSVFVVSQKKGKGDMPVKRTSKKQEKSSGNLLNAMRSTTPPPTHHSHWSQKLPPDQLQQLSEVRDAYSRGELPGWTTKMLYDFAKQHGMQIPVTVTTFRHWLSDSRHEGQDDG